MDHSTPALIGETDRNTKLNSMHHQIVTFHTCDPCFIHFSQPGIPAPLSCQLWGKHYDIMMLYSLEHWLYSLASAEPVETIACAGVRAVCVPGEIRRPYALTARHQVDGVSVRVCSKQFTGFGKGFSTLPTSPQTDDHSTHSLQCSVAMQGLTINFNLPDAQCCIVHTECCIAFQVKVHKTTAMLHC